MADEAAASTKIASNKPPKMSGIVHGFARESASCIALVLANLVPLAGVVFFGWSVFVVLFSCWMENVVTGVFNVLRMAVASGGIVPGSLKVPAGAVPGFAGVSTRGEVPGVLKSLLIPFFMFHYGVFTLVHGVFVVAFFSGLRWIPMGPGRWRLDSPLPTLATLRDQLPAGILIVLAGMIVSHGVSYVTNFVQNGEYRRVSVLQLFMQPYHRVAVVHLTILAGGFAVLHTGANQLAVAALVLLKIAFDLYAHVSERRKFAGSGGLKRDL